jgi:beta-glucosidase
MIDLFNKGCYSTTPITRKIDGEEIVLVPGTTSCDGPTGMVTFMGKSEVYQTCYYCSECLVAQTYNLELAKEQAEAIGQESLVGNLETGLSYPGWYAPGVNLHRSPFSGRNTEYYSEDPLLCGKFAATVIAGVQSRGVYANVKHFALNDQETNRSAKGIATWCDEQAMRELYLRPFEIAVKEGKTKGLMTSFNRVGTTWAGGDYRLVTTVLRKEWGFVGSVICDFHTSANDYMDSKQMLYAGGDLNLAGQETVYLKEGSGDIDVSSSNKKDVILLRNASHNLLYCIANSNAMKAEVIGYRLAVWEILLTVGTVVVCVGIAGWGAWAILTSLRKKDDVVAEAN